MAELRDGCDGALVPQRGAGSHRCLLPFEVELCEALGITAEEYFYFQQLSDAYNGKRAEEYDLAGVPDAQAGFLIPIVISLAVGIAVSAIGALLAPKPSSEKQKTPPQLRTADQTSAKRYLQSEGFSGVQDVAVLGETIPVVFAKRVGDLGGVRVNAMLLWSQLLSRGTGQQLKAAMLLSLGRLAQRPDFVGYAIGDQTLKNYTESKIGLYYRPDGGRLAESDRYSSGAIEADPSPNDILAVFANASGGWQPWFSATRTPSTQTQFGLYRPMPNASIFRVPYELVLTGKDAEQRQRNADNDKRAKIRTNFPTFAAVYQSDSGGGWLQPGQKCRYVIAESQEDPGRFAPWGLDDVNASTEDERAAADEQLQVGDSYMVGGALAVLESQEFTEPWLIGRRKHFTFRCLETGPVVVANAWSPDNQPYGFVVQRVALATIANSRDCDLTELGIKSTVWRQINGFPNVNSEPDDNTINAYQNDNGSITLGSLSRYNRRMSFFRLEWRKLGETGEWRDLSGGILFYVDGRTPTAQYNFIRIEHPRGQYEFRLKPYPGAWVYAGWQGRDVFELCPGSTSQYWQDGLSVSFSGRRVNLGSVPLSNPDWYRKGEAGTWTTRTVWRWQKVGELYYAGWSAFGFGYRAYMTYSYDSGGRSYSLVDGQYVNLGEVFSVYPGGWFGPVTQYRYERGRYMGNAPVPWGGSVTTYAIDKWAYQRVEERVFVPSENLNPFDVIADYKIYDAENSSHFDGPEHEVVYVNEQVRQNAVQYDGLSYVGLRLNSTKEWASFQQLSAYIKQGVEIERLIDDSGNPVAEGQLVAASNNLAEIAYTLLVDKRIGAGASVGRQAVSRERMQQAARWCHANQFTWDGVISEPLNLRQWIYEQAGYCLLDFTILGGQFSLVPSFPQDSSYKLDRAAKPKISALFTDGNIRDLKVAWLSPEERQLFKAVVKWRQETENGFSRTRALSIRLSDGQGGSDRDPEEDFDLSLFCTSIAQARTFARTALKLRQKVNHGLTFETTPQAAMGLEPGAYFRFVSEVTHTSRFSNGTIGLDGKINSAEPLPDGDQRIIYWVPGTEGVKEGTIAVANGSCTDAAFWGTVFTLANTTTSSRLYKVETLAMGEEGFVTISGSHQPLTDAGSLAVLDWDDSHFVEEGA
jgi:hypothetical protein